MMRLEDLVRLYILQKNVHEQMGDPLHARRYVEECDRCLAGVNVLRVDQMAPALFPGQPNIPFVLFKPELATPDNPRPLIIHTHGGPESCVTPTKTHAELEFFMSQGYVVACSNYRGSTYYPACGDNPTGWWEWPKKAVGQYHVYGPEDVYAVAALMRQMPFVNKDAIFLHGLSFGSVINSHLLAGVTQGKFESIFAGAHLCAGFDYPIPTSLPHHVPLLITHSERDEKAPYQAARLFMEKLLLRQLSYELQGIEPKAVQTFVAKLGKHHMVTASLQPDEQETDAHKELTAFLRLETEFFASLVEGKRFQPTDTYDQFKAIMSSASSEPPSEEVLHRVHAYQYAAGRSATRLPQAAKPTPSAFSTKEKHYGPTTALLKLKLKDTFTGDVRADLTQFFERLFNPFEMTTFAPLTVKMWNYIPDAGKKVLADRVFMDQMVEAVTKEESFLAENPDHMVLYHAADLPSFQLYRFIKLWSMIVSGKSLDEVDVFDEFRLFDYLRESFDDIDVFFQAMRNRQTRENQSTKFNYLPGFADRAMACNPTLISNSYTISSCTLWWYYKPEKRDPPTTTLITQWLKILGIYSEERLARYVKLFERESDKEQTVLQQIFVPYAVAEKSARMCLIWGEKFGDRDDLDLTSPSLMRDFIRSPEAFEQRLREKGESFPNYEDVPIYGKTEYGFDFTDLFQLRYIPKRNTGTVTFSYVRSKEKNAEALLELKHLIQEDFADYLAYGSPVPSFIHPEAEAAKRMAYGQSSLRFYQPNTSPSLHAFFLQQRELRKGLVQNPSKETYGQIVLIDRESKVRIQIALNKIDEKWEKDHTYLFSLCGNLKGYTYYELLEEAARNVYQKGSERYHFIMQMLDYYCVPSSVMQATENEFINYHQLYPLLQFDLIEKNRLDAKQYSFFDSPDPVDARSSFQLELRFAVQIALRYARLAKEKGYGHDVVQHLY